MIKVKLQEIAKPTLNPENISETIKIIWPNLSPKPNSICSSCV